MASCRASTPPVLQNNTSTAATSSWGRNRPAQTSDSIGLFEVEKAPFQTETQISISSERIWDKPTNNLLWGGDAGALGALESPPGSEEEEGNDAWRENY